MKGVAVWTSDFTPPTVPYTSTDILPPDGGALDAPPTTTDATDASGQTVALFHFNWTDGGTVLTDSSGTGKVATITGNPVISTTQSKFGGASLYVNGGSVRGVDYVTVATVGTDFAMDGDFTIDWWQYILSSTNSFVGIVNLWQNDSMVLGLSLQDNGNNFHINPYYPSSIVSAPSAHAWHHIAITRAGAVYRGFIDGQVVYTNSSSTGTLGGSPLAVSCPTPGPGDNGDFNGYIDEIRVVKGLAVWTSNFTPPTAEY